MTSQNLSHIIVHLVGNYPKNLENYLKLICL